MEQGNNVMVSDSYCHKILADPFSPISHFGDTYLVKQSMFMHAPEESYS